MSGFNNTRAVTTLTCGDVKFTPEYKAIVSTLVHARVDAGLSQRQLARRISRSQSHIWKIENLQRRIELLEFCRIALALGSDPEALFGSVLRALRRTQGHGLPTPA